MRRRLCSLLSSSPLGAGETWVETGRASMAVWAGAAPAEGGRRPRSDPVPAVLLVGHTPSDLTLQRMLSRYPGKWKDEWVGLRGGERLSLRHQCGVARAECGAAARADIAGNVKGYACLIRLHIEKEEAVIHPLADRLLSVEGLGL